MVAYAHAINKVTLSGTMFGGAEIWSTSFFIGQKDGDAGDPTQAAADAIRDLWQTFFTSSGASIGANWNFTTAKVAHIDNAGHTVDGKVFYSGVTSTKIGANAGSVLPPQNSLVCTLLSDRPRGLAAKGRMYIPGVTMYPDATGHLSSVAIGNFATGLKTFFDGVNGSVDVPDSVILAAAGTGPLPGFTAQNDWVRHIKVGNVMDTQRRRRNSLQETYTPKDLV